MSRYTCILRLIYDVSKPLNFTYKLIGVTHYVLLFHVIKARENKQ